MEAKQGQKSDKQKVGIVTDPDMTLHRCTERDHPERPERLTSIVDHLKRVDLISKCTFIDKLTEVDDEHIKTLHAPNYIEYVKKLCEKSNDDEDQPYADTYYNKSTDMCARKALQGAKILADKVMAGELTSGYGILRPPGHHANVQGSLTGFCIFNTIALTAKYAKEKYNLKRILIFDWDVHHGDSTQKFLYEDAQILFISLHRFDEGYFYPGKSGMIQNVGAKAGEGFNLNLPWDSNRKAGPIGDSEYIYVFERIAYPIIKKFDPELIFVSAGFDSGRGDPLGGLDLTEDGYAYMLRKLQLVQPRIIIGLEGGYNLNTISIASEACVRVLLGEELPLRCASRELDLEELKETVRPNVVALRLVAKALKTFGKYWSEVLESKELLAYDLLVAENNKYAALKLPGEPELFRVIGDRFFQSLRKSEEEFFKLISEATGTSLKEFQNLQKWLPNYYGTAKFNCKEYLGLENYLPQFVGEVEVVRVQVSPSFNEDNINASIVLRVKFDSSGLVTQTEATGSQKISFADLATLSQKKVEVSSYDPCNWKQFKENHEPPKESLKGFETAVDCVRAAQLALDKDYKLQSITVMIIKNAISVLEVKVTNGWRV